MIINALLRTILLGSAFDLLQIDDDRRRELTKYIFNSTEINANLQVIPQYSIRSGYLVPKSAAEVDTFLEIDPGLSLKARKGDISLPGLYHYYRTPVNWQRTVETLMRVYVEVENQTFPSNISVESGWKTEPQEDVGTHYVKSVTRGGQLLISFNLKDIKPEDVEDVRSVLSSKVGNAGDLDDSFFRNFQSVLTEVVDKCTFQITISGTLETAFNVHGFQKLVNEYPERLKTGKEDLILMKMELVDLSTLQSNYSAFVRNSKLIPILKEANDKFDDIQVAHDQFSDVSSFGLDDAKKRMVTDFDIRLNLARNFMLKAIEKLDLTGSENQFDQAFGVYNFGGGNVPYKYIKQILKIEEIISRNSSANTDVAL